ncbi:hypothetical protein [Halocatena halophila]|uniref:hypothetical protein n=1 Tax=Halocatena halophila TaxID=2814576 RepID=UPI002ED41B5B
MISVRRLGIALVAIGVVLSAVYATGAFDSMTASRTATVNVAGDASGYLGLQPAPGPNGKYATDKNGKLRVAVDETADAAGAGVNAHSTARLANVFTVTNQGTAPVALWFSETDDAVTLERGTTKKPIEGSGNAVALDPGSTVSVTLAIDASETGPETTFRPLLSLHGSSDLDTVSASGGASGQASDSAGDPSDGEGTPRPESVDPVAGNGSKPSDSKATPPPEEETVSFGPLEIKESDAQAFKDGLLYGEVGMPGGVAPKDTSSSPYYMLAQFAIGFVPGLGDFADARDAIQSGLKGDVAGMVLSGAAAIPGLGFAADGTKLVDFTKDWIKRFSSKTKALSKAFAKHVATHMPDKQVIQLLDLFSGGRASELKESGKSVDEIIELAEKGSLKKDPNEGKKLVADGGSSKTYKGASTKKINDKIDKIHKYKSSKLTSKIDKSDISNAGKDSDGDTILLLDTNKWNPDKTNLVQTPGWRHIIARHVHQDSKYYKKFKRRDGYPTEPARKAGHSKDPPTMFPKNMKPDEIKSLIMVSAKKGDVVKDHDYVKKNSVVHTEKQ